MIVLAILCLMMFHTSVSEMSTMRSTLTSDSDSEDSTPLTIRHKSKSLASLNKRKPSKGTIPSCNDMLNTCASGVLICSR